MTRKDEPYKNGTETFMFYNRNPKNRNTTDCVIRAISTALDKDYNETLMEMAELSCKTGYMLNDKKGIERYLASKGWVKHKQPRKSDNTKYTGKEWCEYISAFDPYAYSGNIVANIGGHHLVAIKPTFSGDGFNCRYKVHDTWDSTYKCVGNYWVKEND